jgi:hypothetical protein
MKECSGLQSQNAALPALNVTPGPVLQRKCACGNHTTGGDCDECSKKKEEAMLQRSSSSRSSLNEVPSIVHEVLQSSGESLDESTRAFFEPRFHQDFSRVRIHTDSKAAESARAVSAQAYTFGRNVVFEAGQYAPHSVTGRLLLAHELVHVMQQEDVAAQTVPSLISSPEDNAERLADTLADSAVSGTPNVSRPQTSSEPRLFRRVGAVNCPPNVFGAPADPKAALEGINTIAVDFATRTADALAADAEITAEGIPESPSATLQAFQNTFGQPNAVGKGFMNRLTGKVRPSLEVALSEELRIVSRRFRFSARILNQTVNFRCPGNSTVTLPGCAAGSCGPNFAFSCRGGGTMALCEPFWGLADDNLKAGTFIHESLHIIFGTTNPREIGQIGEETQQGAGRNFNVAGCYEFLVDAAVGMTSNAVCPPVP